MIKTITSLPPQIFQSFSKDLLLGTLERINLRKDKILIKALKKIRSQDKKKKSKFDILIKELEELHGRKTIEKNEYDKERKESYQEMSFMGATMRFERPKKL